MRKKKLRESVFWKSVFYVTAVASVSAMILSAVLFAFLSQKGVYEYSREESKEERFADMARLDALKIMTAYFEGHEEEIVGELGGTNVQCVITSQSSGRVKSFYDGSSTRYVYRFLIDQDLIQGILSEASEEYEAAIYLREDFPYHDKYRSENEQIDLCYDLKGIIVPVCLISGFLAMVLILFLVFSAGYRRGVGKPAAEGLARLPFDLLTLVLAVGAVFVFNSYGEFVQALGRYFEGKNLFLWNAFCLFLLLAGGSAVALGYLLILAIQVKTGTFWRHTIIGKVYFLGKRILNGCRRLFHRLWSDLPLVWKFPLLAAVMFLAQCVFLAWLLQSRGGALEYALLALELLVILGVLIYFAGMLQKLKEGGAKLAAGQLQYQVDVSKLSGACRKHGEHLNSIGESMNRVVEERMKSERMKTELITNVSHDIKTPLTSIINYTDLIVKEKTENEKIMEYSLVLKRQSARLKKLIEDLVEVSKVSTGNVEVHMAPCEVGVLLTQIVGEYEQRLSDRGLMLVAKQVGQPARIMADGMQLWRVFDNLLNNILKYAQPDTRVYLTVEESGGMVRISFKNISRYQLDISVEELKERFVRGDHSRNTEGNGLGLSIAESLVKLQGGEMELNVDGDLFKAEVRFPSLPREEDRAERPDVGAAGGVESALGSAAGMAVGAWPMRGTAGGAGFEAGIGAGPEPMGKSVGGVNPEAGAVVEREPMGKSSEATNSEARIAAEREPMRKSVGAATPEVGIAAERELMGKSSETANSEARIAAERGPMEKSVGAATPEAEIAAEREPMEKLVGAANPETEIAADREKIGKSVGAANLEAGITAERELMGKSSEAANSEARIAAKRGPMEKSVGAATPEARIAAEREPMGKSSDAVNSETEIAADREKIGESAGAANSEAGIAAELEPMGKSSEAMNSEMEIAADREKIGESVGAANPEVGTAAEREPMEKSSDAANPEVQTTTTSEPALSSEEELPH